MNGLTEVIIPKSRGRAVEVVKHRRKRDSTSLEVGSRMQSIENKLAAGTFLKSRTLGNLPQSVLEGLNAISSLRCYPKGTILFVEGQQARGVFILLKGRARLSTACVDGKSLLLRIAEPDEIIGLPGTISRGTYALTAQAVEPTRVNFIHRGRFLEFLREHGDVTLRVAEILDEIYHGTFQKLRCLALSGSARERLARFLLHATASAGQEKDQPSAALSLTQEEIAEMIGMARETITRLFTSFKRDHLIELRGSLLTIADRAGLEGLLRN